MIVIWERFKAASRSLIRCIEWTYSHVNPPPYPPTTWSGSAKVGQFAYRNWEPHLDHDDPGSTSEEVSENDHVREVSAVGKV